MTSPLLLLSYDSSAVPGEVSFILGYLWTSVKGWQYVFYRQRISFYLYPTITTFLKVNHVVRLLILFIHSVGSSESIMSRALCQPLGLQDESDKRLLLGIHRDFLSGPTAL